MNMRVTKAEPALPGLSRPAGPALAVLVVDDEAGCREEITDALARRGLTVLAAASARAALRLVAERADIGALVTDIRMPGTDGLALAEAVLAGRTAAAAIEVVLVTGYATPAYSLAAERIGACPILAKPVRGTTLAGTVETALARAAARRRAAAIRPPSGPMRVSAHAAGDIVAARLKEAGIPCSRRIMLQPDADPAYRADSALLGQATALIADAAVGLAGGPVRAELGLDAGAGEARFDLVLRPHAMHPAAATPGAFRTLPLPDAARLLAAQDGRLEAWSLPGAALQARLFLRGA